MSATPIPRTLNMALAGLRDLSILSSPPEGRLDVHTEVTKFSTQLLDEVIGRELARGGQVFFVHNRVETIATLAKLIQETVPKARVAICHGQMSSVRLEEIMVDFIARRVDVLVCTAIIESGIDIPSANTMIINHAESFGLSQLYQLRGRIGRGRDRGYAYLLIPGDMQITDEAQARLETMKRFCELGSGYGVASHDLEQRGGGDLLGANQSGHVAAVGLELYGELLAEALQRAKNSPVTLNIDPEIQIPFAALLSEMYIADPGHRLDFYDKLSSATQDNEIDDIFDFFKERYGHVPEEAMALREVMLMRCRMKKMGATHLRLFHENNEKNVRMLMTFAHGAPIDTVNVALLCQKNPETYMMQPSGKLSLCLHREGTEQMDILVTGRKALGVLRVRDEHA
jgi:transcription-repair coupling factor (superfamily II helicase)